MRLQMVSILILMLLLARLVNSQDRLNHHGDIEWLFDSYFAEVIDLNPEFATILGVDSSFGVQVQAEKLTDVSDAAYDKELALVKKYYGLLQAINDSVLTPSQKINKQLLIYDLKITMDGERFRYHPYIINPMFGVHNSLTRLMTEYHPLETLTDVNNYLKRLKSYELKFDQLLNDLEVREKERIYPPKVVIRFMADIMADFISVPPGQNILAITFQKKIKKSKGIDKKQKKELRIRVGEYVKDFVYPAYKKFIIHLDSLTKKATNHEGVWKLPNGDDYYAYCLKRHTTTSLTAEEIFQIGLNEVKRIRQETIELMLESGVKENVFFSVMLDDYWNKAGRNEPLKLYYPSSGNSAKQAINDYKAYLKQINRKLPEFFSVRPKNNLDVLPVPEFMEMSMGAFYSRATLDGKKKAIFYVNTSDSPFKPGMQTLALHEGLPGHHFQISLQQESKESRLFRNLTFFTAFIEGWALYAEKLGKENGWFGDDYSKMGYLNSEMLRAVRLVLDTGIHYKKWSRDRAYGYMMENLGYASFKSIDRYIVWPGQACAYKIGELKILALRERARKELGEYFDIREFHQTVLENGAIPLEILEEQVEKYLYQKKK